MSTVDIKRPLPDSVIHNDKNYPIQTDFRAWLYFDEKVRAGDADFRFLFPGDSPYCLRENAFVLPDDVYRQLVAFYACENEIPHGDGGSSTEFDWRIDSDYVYGAFYQA